ncbi:hypothetical protein A3Q56_04018 [Intoshia linei]|uniref:Uncharacterized protein n=1 Tax=Intoshia linei TaxID=1819745 RepID=A0A177B4B7_9BILA|nr:hypothetical protein A3Q56_04018 [Intoshia linei]
MNLKKPNDNINSNDKDSKSLTKEKKLQKSDSIMQTIFTNLLAHQMGTKLPVDLKEVKSKDKEIVVQIVDKMLNMFDVVTAKNIKTKQNLNFSNKKKEVHPIHKKIEKIGKENSYISKKINEDFHINKDYRECGKLVFIFLIFIIVVCVDQKYILKYVNFIEHQINDVIDNINIAKNKELEDFEELGNDGIHAIFNNLRSYAKHCPKNLEDIFLLESKMIQSSSVSNKTTLKYFCIIDK